MTISSPGAVLFDLDGTLMSSAAGFLHSMTHALRTHGYPVPEEEVLLTFIGPPLESSVGLLGLDETAGRELIDTYRGHYGAEGIARTEPFEGIPELLADLSDRGRPLAVASSKSIEFVERILAATRLLEYFDVVAGARDDGRLSDKALVVREALDRLAALGHDISSAVLVGDREHDVVGARRCGIDVVLVSWGYGTADEADGATVADSPAQLAEVLDNRSPAPSRGA